MYSIIQRGSGRLCCAGTESLSVCDGGWNTRGLIGKTWVLLSWNLPVHPSSRGRYCVQPPTSPSGIDLCPQAPSQKSLTAPRTVGKLTSENMCHVLLSHSCCAAGPSPSPVEGNTNRRTAGGDGGQVKQGKYVCTCTRIQWSKHMLHACT